MAQTKNVRRYYRLAKLDTDEAGNQMEDLYWVQMTAAERDTIDTHYNRQNSWANGG